MTGGSGRYTGAPPRGRDSRSLSRPLSLAGAAAFSLVLLALLAIAHETPARAETGMTLGLDTQPESNSVASIGPVQTCAGVEVGQEFPVDVYVTGVTNLKAFELRVNFDSRVLSLQNADYGRFLLSTPPEGSIFPSLFEAETQDTYFLAASEFRGTPDTGSGVLARLTFKAIGQGKSQVSIPADATYGARLTDAAGRPTGDLNGDSIWDEPVSNGQVAVGQPCSGSPPVATPRPPGGDASPPPSPDAGGDNGNGRPAPGADGSVVSVIGDGANGGDGSSGSSADNPDAGQDATGNGVSDVEGAAVGPHGEASGESPARAPDSSDSSPWLIALVFAAVAAAGVGGTLAVSLIRRRL